MYVRKTSVQRIVGSFFLELKQLSDEFDHQIQSNVKVENGWNFVFLNWRLSEGKIYLFFFFFL
jgi:hypothetical protein